MNNWLSRKLFSLAAWLDWREVVFRSMAVLLIEAVERRVIKPKKRGRPLGSKDKKPRKSPVRKAARPIPVANACTGATPYDEAVKLAFPRESKSKPKV